MTSSTEDSSISSSVSSVAWINNNGNDLRDLEICASVQADSAAFKRWRAITATIDVDIWCYYHGCCVGGDLWIGGLIQLYVLTSGWFDAIAMHSCPTDR